MSGTNDDIKFTIGVDDKLAMSLDDIVKKTKQSKRGNNNNNRRRMGKAPVVSREDNGRKKQVVRNTARRASLQRSQQVDRMRGIEYTDNQKTGNNANNNNTGNGNGKKNTPRRRNTVAPRVSLFANTRERTVSQRRGRGQAATAVRRNSNNNTKNNNNNNNNNGVADAVQIPFVNPSATSNKAPPAPRRQSIKRETTDNTSTNARSVAQRRAGAARQRLQKANTVREVKASSTAKSDGPRMTLSDRFAANANAGAGAGGGRGRGRARTGRGAANSNPRRIIKL